MGRLIVFFVALVPAYFIIYSIFSASSKWSVSTLALCSSMITIMLHLFYGYVWAKWVTGSMSVVLGGFQVPVLVSHPLTTYSALVGSIGALVITSGLMLLLASPASAYLERRRTLRTSNVARLLTTVNVLTLSLILIEVAKDVHHLMS